MGLGNGTGVDASRRVQTRAADPFLFLGLDLLLLRVLGFLFLLTMAPSIEYYCPCVAASPQPPPPHLASSSYSFHPLHNLFFCEECDAVRCNRCVMVEVSGYYCPNCLFEVPSASVRAEKNR